MSDQAWLNNEILSSNRALREVKRNWRECGYVTELRPETLFREAFHELRCRMLTTTLKPDEPVIHVFDRCVEEQLAQLAWEIKT